MGTTWCDPKGNKNIEKELGIKKDKAGLPRVFAKLRHKD